VVAVDISEAGHWSHARGGGDANDADAIAEVLPEVLTVVSGTSLRLACITDALIERITLTRSQGRIVAGQAGLDRADGVGAGRSAHEVRRPSIASIVAAVGIQDLSR